MSHRIVGVVIGGMFIDLLYLDRAAGDVRLAKVPTTTDNQAFGVLEAHLHRACHAVNRRPIVTPDRRAILPPR